MLCTCRDSSGACLCINAALDRQKAHHFLQRVPKSRSIKKNQKKKSRLLPSVSRYESRDKYRSKNNNNVFTAVCMLYSRPMSIRYDHG